MTALSSIQRIQKEFQLKENGSPLDLEEKYGQPGHIPDVKNNPEIQRFNWELINTDDFLFNLDTQANSQKTLTEIHSLNPVFSYMTSRLPNTRKATESWLKKHNYPDAPIIFREDHVRQSDWKLSYLDKLRGNYLLIDDSLEALGKPQNIHRSKFVWFNPYKWDVPDDLKNLISNQFHNW